MNPNDLYIHVVPTDELIEWRVVAQHGTTCLQATLDPTKREGRTRLLLGLSAILGEPTEELEFVNDRINEAVRLKLDQLKAESDRQAADVDSAEIEPDNGTLDKGSAFAHTRIDGLVETVGAIQERLERHAKFLNTLHEERKAPK